MHSEYKNDHTYFLAFTVTVLLNYLKFAKKKKKNFYFRNFDWLTKITHILDRCVYLKRPKRLFEISNLVLSPENGNLAQYL